MENYMKQVAEMLGVELGEKFKTEYAGNESKSMFRITERGCEHFNGVFWDFAPIVLESILLGEEKVKKLPYKPKKEEMYWTYDSLRQEFFPYKTMWMNTVQDYARLKCGMVFRTEEEAIEARPRIYRELTGKEWKEDE